MRVKTHAMLRKVSDWWRALQPRERMIVSAAGVVGALAMIWVPIAAFQSFLDDNERMLKIRTQQIETVQQRLQRYHQLKERFEKIQTTFRESQMTFEQVTSELDKIVKQTIGSDNYDLKKSREPSKMGDEFEKQDFTLRVHALTLPQLVKLLYEFEQGTRPLFLGKVDLQKTPRSSQFSTTMEVFSIRKAQEQTPAPS